MSEIQMIMNDTFWKFLTSLEELKVKKEKSLFCASLNVDEKTLVEFQTFLTRFDVNCETDNAYIYPLKTKCKIKMEFSLTEWLALQANYFNKDSGEEFKHYYQTIVKNKLHASQLAFEQFNLAKKPKEIFLKTNQVENLKKKMDHAIAYKKTITIEFFNNKTCTVFPHRLVFLDGILCIIGESLKDKMLVYFGVEDINDINDFEDSYEPNLSQIEVNEFICHLRLISGKEERLVLKIYSQYETDLLPTHHFLGNPFITSNTEGDMIWAATIEVCEDLFQWLYSMKDRAEVLDPGHVKKEFAHFCELKKEHEQFKKVS